MKPADASLAGFFASAASSAPDTFQVMSRMQPRRGDLTSNPANTLNRQPSGTLARKAGLWHDEEQSATQQDGGQSRYSRRTTNALHPNPPQPACAGLRHLCGWRFLQLKIFVSIASYRDADLQNTVHSLFHNAWNPHRVRVGVYLQADEAETDCMIEPNVNVRVRRVNAAEARGAGWARARVMELMQDEDYVLQVDSHMRFAPDWDEKLIQMLPPGKSILSGYPLSFTPPEEFAEPMLVKTNAHCFEPDGILTQRSGGYALDDRPPERSAFIAAGLVFSPAQAWRDCPVDEKVFFIGEEILSAVRFWTSGWDIYTPNQAIAWHNYNPRPRRVWDDRKDQHTLETASRARVVQLVLNAGGVRTLEAYEAFSGVDFRNRTIRKKTMNIQEVKAYVESHFAEAEQAIKDKFDEVVAFVERKQAGDAAKVAAEIADLQSKGYTVTGPSV